MKFVTPVLSFLLAACMVGAWVYVYMDIQASAAQITTYQGEVSTVAARDAFLRSADDFLAQSVADREEALSYLTPASDTASAIVLVENAGKSAKVTGSVQSAVIVPTGAAHHEQLEVTVTARGTFAAQGKFGTLLETLPRASYVKSMELESSEAGWLGTYTISFVKLKL